MADPTTPSAGAALVLAAAIAAFGPLVGQYVIIVVGAFGGCLVALMSKPPGGVLSGLKYIGIGLLVAVFTTGPIAFVWSEYLKLPLAELLSFASFVIGLKTEWVLSFVTRKVDQ